MDMRLVLTVLFVLALFPATGLCAERPLIVAAGGGESLVLTARDIQEGRETAVEAAMPEPVLFLLRRGSPNGVSLNALYGDAGENLLATLPQGLRGFDEYGELEPGFSLQFAVRDLNGDHKAEVLVATGDGAAILTAAVFTYSPHESGRFRCTGLIEGQNTLHVDENGVITAPYGSQGLFEEYAVAVDGAVVKKERGTR